MREKTGNGHNVDLDRFLEDIKSVVRDGQELLKAGVGTLKEQARVGAERTGTYVREKPYQTVGVAFGLGVLAGMLVAGMFRGQSEEQEAEE